MAAYLNGLACAVPRHELPQRLVQHEARAIFATGYPQIDKLMTTFATAGIERRYSVVPLTWFAGPKSWRERNDLYLETATALFVEVARAALDDAGWRADQVDCVVGVSSTGVATPTLDARASSALGLRPDVRRVPLFGLGCAGGVTGLSVAQGLAAARPGSKVLLVVVETCSLSFRADRLQKADIIAAVLFGDGAAAACVSTIAPTDGLALVTLGEGIEHTWPDTLSIMGWDVDDAGLGVVFDRSIPDFTLRRFADAVDAALRASGDERAAIDRFVCHPGGLKVIEAIERALDLGPGRLDAERQVLRRFGNMSAPTALFVLETVLEQRTAGRMLLCALGPGFTASFVPLMVEAPIASPERAREPAVVDEPT